MHTHTYIYKYIPGAHDNRRKIELDLSVVARIGPVRRRSSSQPFSQSHSIMMLSEPQEARYLIVMSVCLFVSVSACECVCLCIFVCVNCDGWGQSMCGCLCV